MIMVMFFTMIAPINSYGLTGGPAQPEFNSFTPIGTSDMVNLNSGDFTYNIPIMDIGGFPINLAYSSGITTDQEASWVGLGWDLSIGQINRQMRGLPDDFLGADPQVEEGAGDVMVYENNLKHNYTVGAEMNLRPALFGLESNALSVGISGQYNSFSGYSITPSAGITYQLGSIGSIGLNVRSTPDGLSISPNLSIHAQMKGYKKKDNELGASFGVSFNSRQGLSNFNMSASRTSYKKSPLGSLQGRSANSSGSLGSTISFVDNHYTPTIQNGLTTLNFTFNTATDGEFIGVESGTQIRAFGSDQYFKDEDKSQAVKAYGYENNHLAQVEDIRDFNREKDGNFSVNTTNLPITNYTYDIYSVKGQGVAGMFRPYRSQVGYVNDNEVSNDGGGISLGGEIGGGNAFRIGADVEVTITSNKTGVWSNNNSSLTHLESDEATSPFYEEIYFKNVGDLSSDSDIDMYGTANSGLGEYQPIRLNVNGIAYSRSLSNSYSSKDKASPTGLSLSTSFNASDLKRSNLRVRRNQNILQIKNKEISTTDGVLLGFQSNLNAKPHHTAGFIVTRNDGARYIYGEALYNTTKEEVTFAVGQEVGDYLNMGVPSETGDCASGLVDYIHGEDNTTNNTKGDQYFNKIITPSYAHTYLLTNLLSTDYSDIDGDGPSENDLGSYTQFKYQTKNTDYQWRVPFGKDKANYNEGLRTDPTDDKGSYVYGKKEMKYIHKIETKTHIAVFDISKRADGIGANVDGSLDDESVMWKIDSISLYSKGEYYSDMKNKVEAVDPTPIKVAHFEYDYYLCQGVPNFQGDLDPDNVMSGQVGKLTLRKVYFTYRNSNMGKYNAYEFNYGDIDHDGTISTIENNLRNPNYNLKAYDIWGCFKPNNGGCDVLSLPTAPEFNYIEQNDNAVHDYTAAWSISDITLPSSGKIKIDYESDDYTHVQDKQAMRMFKVVGAGIANQTPSLGILNEIDPLSGQLIQGINEALLYDDNILRTPYKYLYVELDENINVQDFYTDYISQILKEQDGLLYFRFFTNMTEKGGSANSEWNTSPFEYITGYSKISSNFLDYNVFTLGNKTYGAIPLEFAELEGGLIRIVEPEDAEDVNPVSKATWNFGRKYLSKYVYEMENLDPGLQANAVVSAIRQMSSNLLEIVAGPNGLLRRKLIGRRFIPEKSWIRLSNPASKKYGGGSRVKQLVMTDEWAKLSETVADPKANDDIRDQKYGQVYDYTLENGYSSGVATYEPVGSKENPLVQPSFVRENRLLAPDEENYLEKPFGESFYASPQVTYGRVSVKNIERVDDIDDDGTDDKVKRHATGYVVTEHFTSKDYPTIVDQTRLLVHEDKAGFLGQLLNINDRKHLTLSQGYVIHLNDMNGKMKSQRVYGEDQVTPISGADYMYEDNSSTLIGDYFNKGKLNNSLPTLSPDGTLEYNTIGVEFDIINDFREMESVTEVAGINGNTANFWVGLVPAIVPLPLPDYARHEDKLNMVTTTKVINTFGIQKEVIAYDAGASVKTKNLLWDKETGEVLLTETVNEYNDQYYSFNYPAHWYYSGMGMACLNAGAVVDFTPNGTNNNISSNDILALHEGDEGIINKIDEFGVETAYRIGWVNAVNTGSNTFNLIDKEGDDIILSPLNTPEGYSFKIIRSGRRNLQSASMGSIVMMSNPITLQQAIVTNPITLSQVTMTNFLTAVSETSQIVNSGAVEFTDDWSLQCECGVSSNDGHNKYRFNEKGVWRAKESHLYLSARNQTTVVGDNGPEENPSPRNDGFYTSFSPFYYLNGSNWMKTTSNDWTSTSTVTSYSQYGFEVENKDALSRYSSAQYGYNFMFPMAVGANSRYSELGFDGFEDYDFDGCSENEHFGFRDIISIPNDISDEESHTGRHSLLIGAGKSVVKILNLNCPN